MHTNSLPPTDRDQAEPAPIKTFPCDRAIRSKLLELRESGEQWSNNVIARRCGVSPAVVSQYLNHAGCIYNGSVAAFEKKALDFLRNEARRRASGIETIECKAAQELAVALEYIRKTSDIGAIIAESGDGKTRGLEPYLTNNPTCQILNVCTWHRNESNVRKFFFDSAPKGDWDSQTNWMDYAVTKLRGSERLFIFDNAHKLPVRSIQLIADFHDETQCPIALVGTFALTDVLEKDAQIYSRIGLREYIGASRPKALLEHIIKSLVPHANGDMEELTDLCEQVAKQPGHFRAVHKQLKLAVELRETSDKFKTWPLAFRAAHTKMMRDYTLR